MDLIYEERLLFILHYRVGLILNDSEKIKQCDKSELNELVKRIYKLKRLLLFIYQHQINLLVDRCVVWSAFELYQFQSFKDKIERTKKHLFQFENKEKYYFEVV